MVLLLPVGCLLNGLIVRMSGRFTTTGACYVMKPAEASGGRLRMRRAFWFLAPVICRLFSFSPRVRLVVGANTIRAAANQLFAARIFGAKAVPLSYEPLT